MAYLCYFATWSGALVFRRFRREEYFIATSDASASCAPTATTAAAEVDRREALMRSLPPAALRGFSCRFTPNITCIRLLIVIDVDVSRDILQHARFYFAIIRAVPSPPRFQRFYLAITCELRLSHDAARRSLLQLVSSRRPHCASDDRRAPQLAPCAPIPAPHASISPHAYSASLFRVKLKDGA